MKRLSIIFLAIFSLLPLSAQTGLAEQLIEACSMTESVQCSFRQTRRISMLENDIVSKGTMSYRKPDVLMWKYTSPEPITFEINGNSITITKGKEGEISDLSANKMYRELARLLVDAVSGKMLADEKVFSSQVSTDGKTITAVLTPKKGELKRMWDRMTMTFDAASYKALRIDIDEASGDTTIIEFSYESR